MSDTEVSDTEVSDTGVEETPEPAGPVIHVPERDLGEADSDDGETPAVPKKRTRRGSRGGKNRRKKPVGEAAALGVATLEAGEPSANGAEPAAVEEPAEQRQSLSSRLSSRLGRRRSAEAESEPADGWGYTPMSEWGMDER